MISRKPHPRNTSHWPWRLTLAHALIATRRERGTVLLMVVGVLALLAIIGVVYATIGRADRSISVATVRASVMADQSSEIASYIAGVIADGSLARYTEKAESGEALERVRRYTYPWTDDHFVSFEPAAYGRAATNQQLPAVANIATFARFSPTGDNLVPWPAALNGTRDTRAYGDPYLATIEPEYLGFPTPIGNTVLSRIRDWRHISNLAPSGNFVNLANLRRHQPNYGGFASPAGFRPGTTTELAGMSFGLTLYDNSGNMIPRTSPQVLPGGTSGNANPANPAHWSNNQIFAYRPAVPEASSGFMPGDYEYFLNQWADTDGDGFVDARFFELSDLGGMFLAGANNPSVLGQVVPARGRYRLFCAARVVDSSAKVNVNVASDFLQGPWPRSDYVGSNPDGSKPALTRDVAYPPGITPSDISLSRVLRLSDVNAALRVSGAAGATARQGLSHLPTASNASTTRASTSYINYNQGVSDAIGDAAYAALIAAGQRGSTAIAGQGTAPPQTYSLTAGDRYRQYDLFGAGGHAARSSALYGAGSTLTRVLRSPFDLSDELDLITYFGVNDSDTLSRLEAAAGGRSTLANADRLSPFRDNRSRSMEMAYRDEFDGANGANTSMFGTANRTAEQALLTAYTDIRHLVTTVNGSRPVKDEGVAPDPTQQGSGAASTDISAALAAIREYSEIAPSTPPTQQQRERRAKAIQLIFKLYANALTPYTNLDQFPSAWDGNAGTAQLRLGLMYGGHPELALRTAMHMTANMVDAFDRDRPLARTGTERGRPDPQPLGVDRNEPTTVGLRLVTTPEARFNGSTLASPNIATDRPYPTLPGDSDVVQLDLNPPAPTGQPSPPANTLRLPDRAANLPSFTRYRNQIGMVKAFGVEPQPFLTEAGVMLLYTDAPDAAGGDDDSVAATTDPFPTPLASDYITMRMRPALTNDDFIGEAIVFQLNNPFDQDIVLHDATGPARYRYRYYLELAGRYYAFRAQNEDTVAFGAEATITLRAGETRTFYVLNPGTLMAVAQRVADINAGTGPFAKDTMHTTADDFKPVVRDWIQHQIKKTAGGITQDPVQLTQINPRTFAAIPAMNTTTQDMDIWDDANTVLTQPGRSIAERRICNLWRLVRSRATTDATSTDDSNNNNNDPSNDILADRLHDPSDPATYSSGYLYDQRTQNMGSNGRISGAVGGDESAATAAGVGANSGFTAVVWAAVRRPTDARTDLGPTAAPAMGRGGSLDASGRPYRGVLPPWCLEARSDSKYPNAVGSGSTFGLNKRFAGSPNDQGNDSDYNSGDTHFKMLRMALSHNDPANPDIGLACTRKGDGGVAASRANLIGQTKDQATADRREYYQVAVEYHAVGEDTFGTEDASAVPNPLRRSRNPALFSRSGDFLLPLAVGPWFDYSRTGADLMGASNKARDYLGAGSGNTFAADREAAWMTLSEALALSCGYYSPEDQSDPYYEFGVKSTISGVHYRHPSRADRGHLVLDYYTPYLLVNNTHQPLGSGVPFALSIIDQFRAAPGVSSTPMPLLGSSSTGGIYTAPEQQTRLVAFGGGSMNLDTPQNASLLERREGVMNLNTQTLNTLRTHPLVTPEVNSAGATLTSSSWIWQSGNYYGATGTEAVALAELTGARATLDYDLAPTIKAFRDRSQEPFRQIGSLAARSTPDFRTTTRAKLTQPSDPTFFEDFRREGPGFKSLGEVALANIYRSLTPGSVNMDANSMFRFAERDKADGAGAPLPMLTNRTFGDARLGPRLSFQPGIISSRFYNRTPDGAVATVSGGAGATRVQQYPLGGVQTPGGYQDKLAIINALSNCASVYSDVFTVHFVIHGYTPEDCDVAPEQPLIPSIAKRYVMVVDRSNVLARGDKPRVLMLKEVPMQ